MWRHSHAGFPSLAYRGRRLTKQEDFGLLTQHLGDQAMVGLGCCNLTKREREREGKILICSDWSPVEGRKHPTAHWEGAELKNAGTQLRGCAVQKSVDCTTCNSGDKANLSRGSSSRAHVYFRRANRIGLGSLLKNFGWARPMWLSS